MVNISIEYTGDLHCVAIHGPSKSQIATDAPTDNRGKGEAFSPTDLVATALGTCIATTFGLVAERLEIGLTGTKIEVAKEMLDKPRRIGRLAVQVRIPLPESCPQREEFERAASHCVVHRSLNSEIDVPIQFHWEG
jgi:putative redox protein